MLWPFRFCPACGTPVHGEAGVAPLNCEACPERFFRPVSVGVAVVLIENRQMLLGRRRDGGWCIPCGYLEWGEEVASAARREFREETGLEVEIVGIRQVQSNFHRPEDLSVGIWFDGRRLSGELQAGDDLVAVQFFDCWEIPEILFPTDRRVIDEWIRSVDSIT
ncbi:NUDIX domain-containing protein [bacterium]|nr:NUDIX domain-containing protein [bacterium]